MLLSLTGAAVGSGMQYRNFIWYAYFVNTPQAVSYEIADKIPAWVVPAGDSAGVLTRSLLHPDWLLPIGIYLVGKLLGTLRFVSGQYILFRLTADLERLPYPMAPISAPRGDCLSRDDRQTRNLAMASLFYRVHGRLNMGIHLYRCSSTHRGNDESTDPDFENPVDRLHSEH